MYIHTYQHIPRPALCAIKTKMVVDMELQEAKDAVFQLMKEKDKIESDLRALKEVLDSVCIAHGFTP